MNTQLKYCLKKLIRNGFTFNKLSNELKKSQYFSAEQLDNLQNRKLRKLIHHCYKNVPYYTELFNKLNLKPADIKRKEDLQQLPFLDKHIVRENFDKLIAKNKNKKLCNVGTTSGTTGTPLNIYRDYHSINFENAAIYRHYNNLADFGLKKMTLRGQVVVPVDTKTPPFWKYNFIDNELIMSSYHLSDKTAEMYIEKIKEFKPQIICAYPSSLYLLAKHFENCNQQLNIEAVFTSSEKIKENQRALIKKVFNCKVYDWYGQAERAAAIGQCEKGTYHIIEDYSITETIGTGTNLDVVGTNLDNYTMPLLRYKTGDTIKLATNKCTCGRCFREVDEIFGRETNYYIMTTEGAKVTTFDRFSRDIQNIIETQIIQEKLGELIINVTTNGKFSEKDKAQLIKNIHKHTFAEMLVTVNEVSEIQRGPNGKFVSVINKLIGENDAE